MRVARFKLGTEDLQTMKSTVSFDRIALWTMLTVLRILRETEIYKSFNTVL